MRITACMAIVRFSRSCRVRAGAVALYIRSCAPVNKPPPASAGHSISGQPLGGYGIGYGPGPSRCRNHSSLFPCADHRGFSHVNQSTVHIRRDPARQLPRAAGISRVIVAVLHRSPESRRPQRLGRLHVRLDRACSRWLVATKLQTHPFHYRRRAQAPQRQSPTVPFGFRSPLLTGWTLTPEPSAPAPDAVWVVPSPATPRFEC